MKISVALATFNGCAFLEEQLESLRIQTRAPDELVVGDDGSTDDSLAIVQKFSLSVDFPVKLLESAPQPFGHEQNFGRILANCTGDLIFFCDQDDIWYPEKIKHMSALFERAPGLGVAVHDMDIVNENLEPTGYSLLQQLRSSGTAGSGAKSLIIGCGTVLNARLLPLVLPIPQLDYGHDTWVHDVGSYLRCRRVDERCLQAYRRHSANSSRFIMDRRIPVTWRDMINASAGVDMHAAYEKRAFAFSTLLERLQRVSDQAYSAMHLPTARADALKSIQHAHDAYMLRANLLRTSGIARVRRWMHMIIGGYYKHFLGWRSAIKDILR